MSNLLVRRFVQLIPLVLGICLLLYLGRLFGVQELLNALKSLRPRSLAAYAALGGVVLLGYCGRWALVLRSVGAPAPLRRLVGIRLAGDALGTLLPGGRIGGDPYRVGVLYARGAPGVAATAGVAADRMLEVVGNSVAALAYVAVYSATRTADVSLAIVVILVLLLVASLTAVAALWRRRRPFSPVLQTLQPIVPQIQRVVETTKHIEDELARFFGDHPATFVVGLLGSLLIELTIVAEYHFLFSAFSLDLDLPTILMILLGGGVARAVPTPAGLGALEASQVTVLALTANRPDVGFVVGLVLRMHETLWLTLGLIAVSVYGLTPKQLRVRKLESATS
ncbi:MAG TPA: lysylphosphatidylglycerol synthase transmembrane domain-containing protein [Candidatus Acidoferrales bacterium]|nr:lysylphosphatidylglycerol synthase transmembrane domain-containing protein [Candidatus Acidoferrales bacterium]